jgi:hypothetical protein
MSNKVKPESKKTSISQKDVLAGMRKSMPPPSSSFKDKKKYDRKKERINFKDYYKEEMGTLGSASTNPGDFSHVAETMYADGQDETTPSVQSLADNVDREQLIQDIIGDLEELKNSFPWTEPLEDSIIKAMAQTLRQAGVEPTDLDAAVGKPAKLQKQYLITGPSSWKGGNGALNDLKAILAGNEPQEITNEQQELTPEDIHDLADRKKIIWDEDPNFMRLTQKLTGKKHLDDLNQEELRIMRDYLEGLEEDESNPAADLPMGSTSAGDPLSETVLEESVITENSYKIGSVVFDNPYGTGRKVFKGIDRIEAASPEQALFLYVKKLKRDANIPLSAEILYSGARKNNTQVTLLSSTQQQNKPFDKPKKFWWQDFD